MNRKVIYQEIKGHNIDIATGYTVDRVNTVYNTAMD